MKYGRHELDWLIAWHTPKSIYHKQPLSHNLFLKFWSIANYWGGPCPWNKQSHCFALSKGPLYCHWFEELLNPSVIQIAFCHLERWLRLLLVLNVYIKMILFFVQQNDSSKLVLRGVFLIGLSPCIKVLLVPDLCDGLVSLSARSCSHVTMSFQ